MNKKLKVALLLIALGSLISLVCIGMWWYGGFNFRFLNQGYNGTIDPLKAYNCSLNGLVSGI